MSVPLACTIIDRLFSCHLQAIACSSELKFSVEERSEALRNQRGWE